MKAVLILIILLFSFAIAKAQLVGMSIKKNNETKCRFEEKGEKSRFERTGKYHSDESDDLGGRQQIGHFSEKTFHSHSNKSF